MLNDRHTFRFIYWHVCLFVHFQGKTWFEIRSAGTSLVVTSLWWSSKDFCSFSLLFWLNTVSSCHKGGYIAMLFYKNQLFYSLSLGIIDFCVVHYCLVMLNKRIFSKTLPGAGTAQWWEGSPPTNVSWVRFRPDAICGLNLLLVLALLRGFFSGFSGFPPYAKTNPPNTNSTRIGDLHENQLRLIWLPL